MCRSPKSGQNLTKVSSKLGRGPTVSKIQEHDLDVKPTKIIKGKCLSNMLTEGNEKTFESVGCYQVNVVLREFENVE
jgi:hypothetical protein